MTLTTGNLKLYGSPANAGAASSIAGEIEGRDFVGGSYSLFTAHTNADPSVGSLPTGMRDFAGFTQSWGRQYSETISYLNSPQIERAEEGSTYAMAITGEELEFTSDRNELTRCTNGGTLYVSGDGIVATFYRRNKQTSDSWIVDWQQDPYLSEYRGGDFKNRDYKWELDFCLMEGEKIFVTRNTAIPVEQVKVGDYVYTAHQHTGELGLYKVMSAMPRPVKMIMRVQFDDGSIVHCTASHKFMTDEGDKRIGEIKEGESVRRFVNWQETHVKMVKKEGIDMDATIHRIEVEDAHTYIGENGIFHHNVK